MRAIDALRDAAQHWYVFVSEDLLFMHARAVVTAFDAYMQRTLGKELTDDLPPRVLPVSTKPPGDFEFLVDREYALIGELLQPGRRQRDEARARIRALLAMEALVTDEVGSNEKDIDRIEKAIRDGHDFSNVFPRLLTVSTELSGEGITLKVHFSKKQGAPVRFVTGDDPEGAAAVREVDLHKKFYMGASKLAKKLKLSEPKAKALRWYLRIDEDANCHHVFEFGKSKHPCFSDNARVRMEEALASGLMIEAVWNAYKSKDRIDAGGSENGKLLQASAAA